MGSRGESDPTSQDMITIVLDGRGEPLCIVENTEVTVRKYNEVDADFAQAEGEGDLSWNTGGKHTGISSHASCPRSAGNFQKTCRWFVNGFG
jgi:uncharacterized protein YhfF